MMSTSTWFVLLVSATMVAAQPLQLECSDDIHCSAGSYCEEYHCFVCIDCNTYNREKPKTNSESCIKSVLDCGKCLEGFVDDRSSEFYPRCGAPGGGGGVSNWVIVTVVAALLVLLLLCVVVVVALRRTRLITSVRTSLESHCVVNRLWPSAPPAPPTAPAPAPPKPESPPPYDLIAPPYNGGPQGDLGESDEQWAMRQRAAAAAARRIGAGLRPRTSPPRDESQSPLVKAGVPRRARLARASAHSATPFNRPDSTYSAAPLNPAYETDEEDSFHLENHFLHNVETTPDTWSPDADTTTLTDDRLRTPASGELAAVDGAVDGAAAPRADGEFTSFSAAFASHPLSPFRTAADAVPPASPDLNPAHPTLPAHPTPPAHTAHPAQSPPEGGGGDGGAAGLGDGSTRQQNVINFMVRLTNVNQHIAG